LVLGLGGFFFLEEALAAVFELPLHLLFVDLDPVFVTLNCAVILSLHLSGLRFSKFDLLLHKCCIFLIIDVLVIQLIFFTFKFASKLVILFLNLHPVHFIFFLGLIEYFFFLLDQVSLRLNLVLESDFLPFKFSYFIDSKFVFLNEFSAFISMTFHLLV